MMRGCDFEVLEPPELVEQVRVLADRLQRALPDGEASLPEDANGSAGAV
jgi:hypothetical protein